MNMDEWRIWTFISTFLDSLNLYYATQNGDNDNNNHNLAYFTFCTALCFFVFLYALFILWCSNVIDYKRKFRHKYDFFRICMQIERTPSSILNDYYRATVIKDTGIRWALWLLRSDQDHRIMSTKLFIVTTVCFIVCGPNWNWIIGIIIIWAFRPILSINELLK